MQTPHWQMFDYGTEEDNRKHYGPGLPHYPPRYDIGKLLGGSSIAIGDDQGDSDYSGLEDADGGGNSVGGNSISGAGNHTGSLPPSSKKAFDPPAFDPSKQLGIFSGTKDTLADPADVLGLLNGLRNRVDYSVEIDDYEHLDYMWATNAHEIFYEDLINAIARSYPREHLGEHLGRDDAADRGVSNPVTGALPFESEIRNVEGEIEQVVFT
jgi:hypothetical protein